MRRRETTMDAHLMELPDVVRPFLDRMPGRLFVGGEWIESEDGAEFDVENPADGSLLARVASGSATDVDRAVSAATRALRGPWRELSPPARGALLYDLADLLATRRVEFETLEVLDVGKPLTTATVELDHAISVLRFFAGAPTRLTGSLVGSSTNRHAYIRMEPIGVCGLIVPWNFPLVLAIWKVGAALAAGATAILKPAEETPLSALRLAELAHEVGIPPGVLNVLTGDGEVGAAIVRHPGVRMISFTGSTNVGRSIASAAAATTKRLTLELGGNSPNIIFADAELESAIPTSMFAAFANSGQICCSGNRLLAHRDVIDHVVDGIAKLAGTLPIGPGLDPDTAVGPLVSRRHLERVYGYVDDGRSTGLELVAGGATLDRPGYYLEPTIFTNVPNDARIAQEEVFGPVLTVTPFSTPEEAVALANDTRYGLAAGLWTQNLTLAHRVAADLEAGTVWVNNYLDFDAALPFGGMKDSGYGRELGDAAIESYTQTKSVIMTLR
jgi:acyl-CoA reductase-like NAD-dependent aldehyde dehydrogenase